MEQDTRTAPTLSWPPLVIERLRWATVVLTLNRIGQRDGSIGNLAQIEPTLTPFRCFGDLDRWSFCAIKNSRGDADRGVEPHAVNMLDAGHFNPPTGTCRRNLRHFNVDAVLTRIMYLCRATSNLRRVLPPPAVYCVVRESLTPQPGRGSPPSTRRWSTSGVGVRDCKSPTRRMSRKKSSVPLPRGSTAFARNGLRIAFAVGYGRSPATKSAITSVPVQGNPPARAGPTRTFSFSNFQTTRPIRTTRRANGCNPNLLAVLSV